jgi:mono/diheme cytochrome c family protein
MVPLATAEEPVAQIFNRAGCVVCHVIPGISGAEGRVGPKLTLGTSGPMRLTDRGYAGQAKTVREYAVESILSPGTYVVPGYPDRVMPGWYGQKLSAAALDKIAAYLEALADEDGASNP